MVNTSKNLLLRNQWTDLHETWFVASETPSYNSLFKWCPWVDLDLFYGKEYFVTYAFSIGTNENLDFSEIIAACDLKIGSCSQLTEFLKVCEY